MVRRAALLAVLVLVAGVPVAFGSASWSTVMHRATVPAGVPRPPVTAHKANGPCNSFSHIYWTGSGQQGHGYADCGYDTYEQIRECLQTWSHDGGYLAWWTDWNTCRTGYTASGGVNAYTGFGGHRAVWRRSRAEFAGAWSGTEYSAQQWAG